MAECEIGMFLVGPCCPLEALRICLTLLLLFYLLLFLHPLINWVGGQAISQAVF